MKIHVNPSGERTYAKISILETGFGKYTSKWRLKAGRSGRALRSRLIRAWRILNETALLAIYLLLFAWNILNVRFV
jgi:hypothetical protein